MVRGLILEILMIFMMHQILFLLLKKAGFKIACIEEIALNNNWINHKQIKMPSFSNCDYSKYLKSLIN